jgi:diguanylate cyclase (GGDEF)-like protein
MKIRKKILVSVSVVWAIFIIVAYAVSQSFLLDSFLKIENARADRDLVRIDEALKETNHSLYAFTSDWAHWGELYDFMQGKDPEFIAKNLSLNAYTDSGINLLTFWDKDSKLKFGAAADIVNKKLISYPQGLAAYFQPNSVFLSHPKSQIVRHGYILIDNQIMMVTAATITGAELNNPPAGTLVTGRMLTPELLQKLAHITQTNLQFYTINEINQTPSLKSIFTSMVSHGGHYVTPIDENALEGYTQITDIYNNPIGFFQMTKPRIIYQAGLHAIHYYLLVFALLGVLLCLMVMALLRRVIIKRLEQLDTEIADIRAKHDITHRVEVTGSDELSSLAAEFNAMLDSIQTSQEELELHVEQRTLELKLTNQKLQEEINERKIVESELIVHKEHLARLAHYDNLTSLPNRVFFNEIFNKALNHANLFKKTLAILFVDLDRFKQINDAFGHNTGDFVLKEISSRLSSAIRGGDVLARLGGDEFIILLNDIGQPKFASPIAEKLLQVCQQPIKYDTQEFFLSASIGICVFPNDGSTLEDLQRNADMAMYRAKRAGGGLYHYFTKELNFEVRQSMQLETGLRKAITNKEFVLYYQPKLNLNTGLISGVEALIRWDHPEFGLLSPVNFIPLAEETGLIMQIGEWVLREACATNKRWQQEGYAPISISVNISAKQFRMDDIAKLVNNILDETGLEAKYLELEITETAVMENVQETSGRLKLIKDKGVSISVDDFGTGYTSISYLKKFPINIIKIDKSFIKGISHDQNDMAITIALIGMAHNLGFEVVAEGVETLDQLNFLTEHGCDIIQGYYISRPLPEKKVVLQFMRSELAL